jgi:hypothetical protein
MRHDYHDVVKRVHARGIAIMGCFVFGMDHDTLESFDETVALVMEARIDLPRYAIAVPFPATGLLQAAERRRAASPPKTGVSTTASTFSIPKNMTADELLCHTRRAWKQTYSYKSIGSGFRVAHAASHRDSCKLRLPFYANHLDTFYTCDWQLAPRA